MRKISWLWIVTLSFLTACRVSTQTLSSVHPEKIITLRFDASMGFPQRLLTEYPGLYIRNMQVEPLAGWIKCELGCRCQEDQFLHRVEQILSQLPGIYSFTIQ